MAAKKLVMACTECGARNYASPKSESSSRTERLELKKFCKHCKQHTLHREDK